MEPLVRLGQTLATLRRLRGLAVEEAATLAGLSSHELEQAESGLLSEFARARIAGYFGLDLEGLSDGTATPALEEPTPATAFLLHGANQDFNPADWAVLERAIQTARHHVTRTEAGRRGLVQRQKLHPVPPAGPLARDAARQGHRLAQQVRERIKLEGAPLGDIRELLEEQLGVVVAVDELSTLNLRAASILDVSRTGAAAVLSKYDRARRLNPRLNRVYLAHELCHLLFDPGAPGSVQIALDDHPLGGSCKASLLESRARGFAAEFLLPRAGLEVVLGLRARPESSRSAALALIEQAMEHFVTPWQITVWHLKNHQILEDGLAGELVNDPKKRNRLDTTTFPHPSEPRGGAQRAKRATLELNSTESLDLAREARALGKQFATDFVEDILASVDVEVRAQQPRKAADVLVERLDALLAGNELDRAKLLLERLDVTKAPPDVLTPVLSLARHARTDLGPTWGCFLTRAMTALESTWGLSEERRRRLARRLE